MIKMNKIPTIIQNRKRFYTRALLLWYQKHKRSLPWRKTQNPYRILISEVMLQQTQVDRVMTHYRHWLKEFPTWRVLANASQRNVLTEWSGMGYNRRALNLHKCAKEVVKNFHGRLPKEYEKLKKLPGIGPYTAGAIRAFAFQFPQAVVDTNVERIQYRFFLGPEVPEKVLSSKEEWELATELYPARSARHTDWNHALMDIGALVCTKRNPLCQKCPLQLQCAATATIHDRLHTYYKIKKKANEPGMEESGVYIPNRIFRGRIIEFLRDNRHCSLEEIGHAIKHDYESYDTPWLLSLLEKLDEEEYITIQGSGAVISLR